MESSNLLLASKLRIDHLHTCKCIHAHLYSLGTTVDVLTTRARNDQKSFSGLSTEHVLALVPFTIHCSLDSSGMGNCIRYSRAKELQQALRIEFVTTTADDTGAGHVKNVVGMS